MWLPQVVSEHTLEFGFIAPFMVIDSNNLGVLCFVVQEIILNFILLSTWLSLIFAVIGPPGPLKPFLP